VPPLARQPPVFLKTINNRFVYFKIDAQLNVGQGDAAADGLDKALRACRECAAGRHGCGSRSSAQYNAGNEPRPGILAAEGGARGLKKIKKNGWGAQIF